MSDTLHGRVAASLAADVRGEVAAALRAENARLHKTSGAVSGRLDSAINRLKSMLEG